MTDRRTFLTMLSAAAAVTGVGTGTAANQATEAARGQENPSLDTEANETDDLEPAEALLAYVEALYGDRLDEEDREVILGGIEGSLASADAFGEVGLRNSDPPAYRFRAYRGDES